jgi:hypothetical protein
MKANKVKSKAVYLLSAAMLVASVFCGPAAADAVLDTVPANCVLCVRVNNLDSALGQFDTFLSGISPMGLSMMARMQLARLVGDPALQGLDTAGSFAFFVTATPAAQPGASPEVLGVMLLPVKDFDQFVEVSPNVAKPDADGISKITISPMGMPPGPNAPAPAAKVLFCTKAGQFAMVTLGPDRAKLLALAKSVSSGETMAKGIDVDQAKLSAEMPAWAYADLDQVNKAFMPVIEKGLAEAQQKMKEVPGAMGPASMGNFSGIIQVYTDFIKAFLQQGKYVSVTVKPEPAVLRIHKTLAAKPDTEMAKFLTADPTLPKENKLIAQLEDGAAMNAAVKISKTWMQKLSDFGISFLKAMDTGDPNAAEEMAKFEQLSKEKMDSMGQVMAFSLAANPGAKPPFIFECIAEIKDRQKYDKVFEQSVQLMKNGALGRMYKNMGMEMSFDITRGSGEYNGVTIDSAKLAMKATDANSQQAQMISAMYGGGFDYRMAYVGDLHLIAVGRDPDAAIKKMIDSVKAGTAKQPVSEVTAALDLLGGGKDADVFGTINYIRLMAVAMGFMPMPMPMPFDQIPTKADIAFDGNVADGKLVADVAVPKEHIMELVTGVQMLMQQQQMQQQQMHQQQMQQGGPAEQNQTP